MSPPSAVPLRIGWMRKTSAQFVSLPTVQSPPPVPIFQTRPWPVTPSPVQRLPARSNATPFAPGTALACWVALAEVGQEAESSDAQPTASGTRSEEHTSELQSRLHLVCRLLLEKKKK